jgi:hypothetical protein
MVPPVTAPEESEVAEASAGALANSFDLAQARLDAAWERYLDSLALTPEQDLMVWRHLPPAAAAQASFGPAFEEALTRFGEALKRTSALLDHGIIAAEEDWSALAAFPPWRRPEQEEAQPFGPLPFRGAAPEGAWSDAMEPEDPPPPPTPDLI